MADEVYVKDTISGEVGMVPAHYLEHPILGANLVQVRNGKRRKSIKDIVDETAQSEDSGDAAETDGEIAETDKKED